MNDNNHRLATIMFSDVVGYTALMGLDETKGLDLLKRNREIQKPLIEKHHGVWIKEMGDGMMAMFDSAYNAVKCATEIQQKARKEFTGKIRIGLHLGEVVVENEDIFGDGVNIASRIESIANPGGIFISEAIQKALKNHSDIQTKYFGPVDLKNVQEQVKLFYVVGNGIETPNSQKIRQLKKLQSHNRSKKRKYRLYLLLAILVACIITINYWYNTEPSRKIEAIAVLPFANFTGSNNEQYFVDIMHDAFITEISKMGDLIVRSRTSTLQFRDKTLSIPEIAKILNVDAIIEASVYKTGDSIKLNMQFIQARPEEDHIWANDYARNTRQIHSLFGDLALTIAKKANVKLTMQQEMQLAKREEVDPEIYKLYMQGQYHWKKLTKKDIELSKGYFDLVLAKEPENALAHAGIAIYYVVYAQMGYISFFEAAPKVKYHADKALVLNDMLPEAHHAAAFNAWIHWDWEHCLPEFRRTLELNPNFELIRSYISEQLIIMQFPEEGIKEAEFAIELDPLNDTYKALYGKILLFTKNYDQAELVLNKALEDSPDHPMLLSTLRSVYHQKKMYPEAIDMWIDSYNIKNDSAAVNVLNDGYKEGGYPKALQRLAELLIRRLNNGTQYVPQWNIATLLTRANNKEEALIWLEKSYESHSLNMPYIRVDPIFDYMRDDPRFQALLNKMKFPS